MDAHTRIITQVPMKEIWRDTGLTISSRGKSLVADDIVALLRVGPIQFVVADVVAKPQWIELYDCYEFWKREVKPHFCDSGSRAILDDYPDAYCHFGSEWKDVEATAPIVLLERHH